MVAPNAELHVRILVIEESSELSASSSRALAQLGVTHVHVPSTHRAQQELAKPGDGLFDAILIDLDGHARTEGLAFLESLRAGGSQLPVVFALGLDSSVERIRLLESGADDSIVKPVEPRELVARLRAVLRRQLRTKQVQLDGFEVDIARQRVSWRGRALDLSRREFDLLWILLQSLGRTVSQTELRAHVCGDDVDGKSNVIAVHASHLREKLAVAGGPKIEAIRGKGYRLKV